MKMNQRLALLSAATVMSVSTLVGPLLAPAQAASKRSRRNIAIGAGALGAYGLLKGNRTVAIAGGLGSAYAYKRYRDAKRSEKNQTIGQVFGNMSVYDSKGNRYAKSSQFFPKRTYYNARGHAIG